MYEIIEKPYCDNVELQNKINNTIPSITGLFPHEIAMLKIVQILKIKISNENIKERLNVARVYSIGIQDGYAAFESLKRRGYIKEGNGYSSLELLKKNQLDKILRENNIEPSYNKSEDIQLIIHNLSAASIEKVYPENLIYILTEKAVLELEFNPEIARCPYNCWDIYDEDITRKQKSYIEWKSSAPQIFRDKANSLKEKLQSYPNALEIFDDFVEVMWKQCKDHEDIFQYYEKVLDKLIEEEGRFIIDTSVENIFFRVPKEYNKRYYIAVYLAKNCNYVIEREDCYELSIKSDDYYTMQMLIYLYKEDMASKKESDDVVSLKNYIKKKSKNDYMLSKVGKILCEVMKDYYYGIYPSSIFEKMYCKQYSDKFLTKEKDKIYDKIIHDFPHIVRWSNEYRLFALISNYIEIVSFQYRANWLGTQSLDIFLDEYKIAIEYQGVQHYEEITFWKSYATYKERDQKKKTLCVKNGIKLLEWKYDQKIDMLSVEKFLVDNNIPIKRKKYSQIKQDYRCMIV